MREGRVNPDLQEERDKCTFDKEELQQTIFYGPMLDQMKSYCDDI